MLQDFLLMFFLPTAFVSALVLLWKDGAFEDEPGGGILVSLIIGFFLGGFLFLMYSARELPTHGIADGMGFRSHHSN